MTPNKTPTHNRVVISRDATPIKTRIVTPRKELPSKSTPEKDREKENQMPGTPGFDNIPLLNCEGPEIEFPGSPTMSAKRRRPRPAASVHESDAETELGDVEGDGHEEEEEELETDCEGDITNQNLQRIDTNFEQLWHVIRSIQDENAQLRERIEQLEQRLPH